MPARILQAWKTVSKSRGMDLPLSQVLQSLRLSTDCVLCLTCRYL